jgi:hypothetical protein
MRGLSIHDRLYVLPFKISVLNGLGSERKRTSAEAIGCADIVEKVGKISR